MIVLLKIVFSGLMFVLIGGILHELIKPKGPTPVKRSPGNMFKIAVWAIVNGIVLAISYNLIKSAVPGNSWYFKGIFYGSALSIVWLLSYLEYPMHMLDLTVKKIGEAVSTIIRNYITDLVLLIIAGMVIAKLFDTGQSTETIKLYLLRCFSANQFNTILIFSAVFVVMRLILGNMIGALGGVVFGIHRFVPFSLFIYYCVWSTLVGGSFATFYILLRENIMVISKNTTLVYAVMIFLFAGLFPNIAVRNIYIEEKHNIYVRYLFELALLFMAGFFLSTILK